MDLFERLNRLASQVGDLIADDLRGHVELGAALLERGDFNGAIHELGLALGRRRDHARALYLLGLARMRRGEPGDFAEARRALTEALAAREGFAEAQVALGELGEREGDFSSAIEGYRAALPLLGEAALRSEVERRLGAVYLRTGRLDKAVRELRKAVSGNPEDPEAQGLLGQALIQRAQQRGEPSGGPAYEAARLCLVRAARTERPSADVLAALGALLLGAGQLADSEKALLRALEVEPASVPALLSLGELRLRQGDVAAAYEQALRAAAAGPAPGTPEAAAAHLLLARCHARSGSPERALLAYEEAAAALPPERSHQEREILDEALRLALRHKRHDAAVALGARPPLAATPDGLAAQALRPDLPHTQAMALLQQALAAGETVEVRLVEAQLLGRTGQIAMAAKALRRAAALGPGDPRPLGELSELYRRSRAALPQEQYGLLVAAHRHLSQTPELGAFAPEASQLLSSLDRPLLLTVMGEFNSGKSTFVNALLGEEVAPMGITPTTATINILKYGRERGGRVVYEDDSSRDVSWLEVPALLRAVNEAEARRIRYVEVLYPLEALQRVNVVDTPGFNSIQPEHEATARAFIAEADAVVWLFTVDQAGKASEREALTEICRQGKQVLGVVNKIDRLPPGGGEPLAKLLQHLRDPEEGFGALVAEVVPFSGRDALLGRREGDQGRVERSNLPAVQQALEERFFARSQAIKRVAARTRLLSLLRRARSHAEALLGSGHQEERRQALRLAQADALLFSRDFIPQERRRLIADTDRIHKLAAREILDFVRPRRWPFGEHQAAPADRDFLLGLLDEQLGDLLNESRGRVVAALGERDADVLHLLDEQVYGHYRAFARGYLRGGKVDDFFLHVLPRLELTEAAVARALERDGPTAIDILEEELLTPLRAFSERRFRAHIGRLQRELDEEELRRLELEERVIYPLEALLEALEGLTPCSG